ncbi:hypothetical protein ABH946_005591 [Bacillus sp. RC145]
MSIWKGSAAICINSRDEILMVAQEMLRDNKVV